MAGMGQRARYIYRTLLTRFETSPPGTKLPTLVELVQEFETPSTTVRQVLTKLEDEEYIVREQGRGTFVRERVLPTILVVDDEAAARKLVTAHAIRAGHRTLEAACPADGIELLGHDPSIALVVSDVRMPDRADGIGFIRAVRDAWPRLPVVAITCYPDDLMPLQGTRHYPTLVVQKPVWAREILEVLSLVPPGR